MKIAHLSPSWKTMTFLKQISLITSSIGKPLSMHKAQRSRYITLGFCILIPIGILSAIPDKDIPLQDWAIVIAIAIGLVLYTLYIGAAKLICAILLRKLDKENVQCASYVEAVQQFEPTKFYKN